MGIGKQTLVISLVALGMFGCGKTSHEEALGSGALKLSGADLKAQLSGNTTHGDVPGLGLKLTVFYAEDGRVSARAKSQAGSDEDIGKWKVNDAGELCITWGKWENSRERCSEVYRQGDKYKTFTNQGTLATLFKVTKGNPDELATRSALEEAIEEGAQKLTAEQARAAYSGNTVEGKIPAAGVRYGIYCAQDGRISGKAKTPAGSDKDTGKWRVTDKGEVCFHWEIWENNSENCNPVYKQGKHYVTYTPTGSIGSVATIAAGNSLKLELDELAAN